MSRLFVNCKLFSILTSALRGPSAIAELFVFQDGSRPLFWIFGANFGTTLNENLMVFIVQNLVAIALVVLKINKFEYFACLD